MSAQHLVKRPSTGELQHRDDSSEEISAVSTQTDVENLHLNYDSNDEKCQIIEIRGKQGMRLDGLVEGTSLEWRFDTGAMNTFITEDVYRSILPEHRPVLERAKKQFTTADGRKLKVIGTAKMLLSFPEFQVIFRVFVADVKSNLLGQDFISKFHCQWDYCFNVCHLKADADGVLRGYSIVSVEDNVVPAHHESVLKATFNSSVDTSDGILLPLKTFVLNHGLAVAREVVKSTCGENHIYVRVFNPCDRDVYVQKRTEIAVFDPVENVSTVEIPEVYSVMSGGADIPEHLEQVYKEACENLTEEQAAKFKDFLLARVDAFADPNKLVERATIGEHRIKLKEEIPFKEAVRRVPIFKREIMDKEIKKLEEQGLIEKSNSPWSAPIVLVQKKDKSWRLCVDYRKLNANTIKDAYPIPRVADDLDALSGSTWFSSLDLNMAYHQIPMSEKDKEKTAFATPRGGLYHYTVMPFGLCNAPATFQRVIEHALNGLQWNITVLYLDDIIVYSRTFDEHLENLSLVLDRLQSVNLKLKAKKCNFFRREVSFLGHIVSKEGIKTDPSKIEAVKNWRTPDNVTKLRSFLGLAAYYRRFIKDFAKIAKCLHILTGKNQEWNWTHECDAAFETLKQKLISAPILGYPDVTAGDFILDTDASNDAIGAVLSQIQNGREVVISYGSRVLNNSERNYCVTRKEMLAVVYFVQHFKHYLLGREFLLRTDHGSLVWLHKFREPDGQIARWLQRLGPYIFKIEHRAGKRHGNADALSRVSCEVNCRQCKREKNEGTENQKYTHVSELRNTSTYNSTEVDNHVFNISALFNDSIDSEKVSDCAIISPLKKNRTNRPMRAKIRKQPDEPLNRANIREKQQNDPGMRVILRWMEKNEKPPLSTVSGENFECKFWYSRWDLLCIDKGVLCIRWISNNSEELKICLPRNLRQVVLWHLHDSRVGGHMGIKKTLEKVRNSDYYWPRMRQTVHDYVFACDVCEERKNPPRKKRSRMKTFLSGETFQRIALDLAGPFPKSENGYSYILVVMDYFTKFAEIFPLMNIEAETVANVLFKGWIKRYGCPGSIHSDQGKQFESRLFQEMCRLFQIDKTRTTPYHPQSDGMVERMNRTIKDMLSKYINANQTDWDRFVDGIVLAYNTTPHETTRISPYRLVFGKEAKLPINVLTENENFTTSEKEANKAVYVRDLEEKLSTIHEQAREITKEASQRQKNYFDRNVRETNYEVGELVRRSQPKVGKGEKLKLSRKWTGPWIIIKRLSDVLFQIQHSRQSKPVIVHADNIKPYRGERQQPQYTTGETAELTRPATGSEYTTGETPDGQRRHAPDSGRRRLKLPLAPPPKTDDSDVDQSEPSLKAEDSDLDQSEPSLKMTRRGRPVRKPIRYRE